MPDTSNMAGTPATAGPVTSGQSTSAVQSDAGTGAAMVGSEGQFAAAPAQAAHAPLGPDGEPEPVGNEAQRAVGAAVAATFADVKLKEEKSDKLTPEQQRVAELEKKLEKARKEAVGKQENQAVVAKAQNEVNQVTQDITRAGQVQSTPGPTPVEQTPGNAVGQKNFQVQATGTTTKPANS